MAKTFPRPPSGARRCNTPSKRAVEASAVVPLLRKAASRRIASEMAAAAAVVEVEERLKRPGIQNWIRIRRATGLLLIRRVFISVLQGRLRSEAPIHDRYRWRENQGFCYVLFCYSVCPLNRTVRPQFWGFFQTAATDIAYTTIHYRGKPL